MKFQEILRKIANIAEKVLIVITVLKETIKNNNNKKLDK